MIKEYLAKCYKLAKGSPDPSNQNGAILIDDVGIIWGSGCNKFPEGIEVTEELLNDREKKLFYIEHAERNAIFNRARNGNTSELMMICPWFACSDCARAIILSGIKKVTGHQERMDMTPDRWKASVAAGLKMLTDCGVELEFWSGKVGCEPIKVNGELWYP